MPLQKLQFQPGVNREATTYANEGGFYSCDKIRFRSGYPEKLGGWVNQAPGYTFKGVARNLKNWVAYTGENLLGIGTSQKFYLQNSAGGAYNDITPIREEGVLGTNPFSTTSGSKLVTVTDTGHGVEVNSFVIFTYGSTVTVGGITLANTDGVEFEVVDVIDANSYKVAATTAASSTTTGGTGTEYIYLLNAGSTSYVVGSGWGSGGWGVGPFGISSSTVTTESIRLWSTDNYEDNLLLNPRGGAIYYWAKNIPSGTTPYARARFLSDVANETTKTTVYTTASASTGTFTLVVDTADFVNVGSVLTGTNIPTGAYVTDIIGTTLTISAATTGTVSSGATITVSYSGRFVPTSTNQLVPSDTNHFNICLGANPYNPNNFTTAFDPMLVRWSDQDNPFDWVPQTTNQSGEQHLAHGSYLVCGQTTRQEILIWSDTSLYSMQYLGPPYVWGFNILMHNISIVSENAAVSVNNVTYWMGVDKFYQYSGRVEVLPCTLRQFIFGDINKDQLYQIVSGTNEGYNEVWWFYPSADSTLNNRYVIYNYLENIWYYGNLSRTAWEDSPSRPYPLASFSVQNSYTTGALGTTDTAIPLQNSDSYPTSGTITIDSEQITYTGKSGGILLNCTRGANGTTAASHVAFSLATYTSIPNQVLYHEYGTDDVTYGDNTPRAIEAYIESSDFDIGDGHNFGFVWRMLPDVTFAGSTAASPQVLITLLPRENSGTNYGTAATPTVTRTATYPVEQYTGEVFTRIRGRQMSFKLSSTALGTNWQLGTPRIDLRPDGRR
jgi:hypothetical protein